MGQQPHLPLLAWSKTPSPAQSQSPSWSPWGKQGSGVAQLSWGDQPELSHPPPLPLPLPMAWTPAWEQARWGSAYVAHAALLSARLLLVRAASCTGSFPALSPLLPEVSQAPGMVGRPGTR